MARSPAVTRSSPPRASSCQAGFYPLLHPQESSSSNIPSHSMQWAENSQGGTWSPPASLEVPECFRNPVP